MIPTNHLRVLRKVVDEQDTIIFVGAGISRWSGLPSWWGLINELADFVDSIGQSPDLIRKELARNDLLQAASYGVDKLTPRQFSEFLAKACRVGTAKPHRIHNAIVELGPNCVITTNYDRLLEAAFAKWRPDDLFRTIGNTETWPIADIIQARSKNFIFKPHGDVQNAENIILTREQYRELRNSRAYVIDALKTLFVSRPILFLGFGLRDNDFLLLKDNIWNTFSGATADHYAVMPDVSTEERDYWRKQYGITIIPYKTKERRDGGSDHSTLLTILEALASRDKKHTSTTVTANTAARLKDDTTTLALARYASNLAQIHGIKVEDEFPVMTRRAHKATGKRSRQFGYETPVNRLLREVGESFILVGAAGSGKTYAMRTTVRDIAESLKSKCLSIGTPEEYTIAPIFVTLRDFDGDLTSLIESQLPPQISLETLLNDAIVRIYIDAANEAPRHDGHRPLLDALRQLIERVHSSSGVVIISSRVLDWLAELGLDVYKLESLHRDYVAKELEPQLKSVDINLRWEIVNLLSKPLLFRMYKQVGFDLPSLRHPVDLFSTMFSSVSDRLPSPSGESIDIASILAPLGFSLTEDGTEVIAASRLLSFLKRSLKDPHEVKLVSDSLVREKIIIPTTQSRLAFNHQTITEYLAATHLARLYQVDETQLDRCLRHRNWDQALFFTVGLLPADYAKRFIRRVATVDMTLALRSVLFADFDSDAVITEILKCIVERIDYYGHPGNFALEWGLSRLPVSESHTDLLEVMSTASAGIAVPAVMHLFELRKWNWPRICDFVLERRTDFNFGSFLARYISGMTGVESEVDLEMLLDRVLTISQPEDDEADDSPQGAKEFVSGMFSKLPLERVRDLFEPHESTIANDILASILYHRRGEEAVKICLDKIEKGVDPFVFALHMVLHDVSGVRLQSGVISRAVVDRLVERMESGDRWAVSTLDDLCRIDDRVLDWVTSVDTSANANSLLPLLFEYVCLPSKSDDFSKRCLATLLEIGGSIDAGHVDLLDALEINWVVDPDLFLQLLSKCKELRSTLFRCVRHRKLSPESARTQPIRLPNVPEWLVWATEQRGDNSWSVYLFADFVQNYCDRATHLAFVSEFNKSTSKFRSLIASAFLPTLSDTVTIDDLTSESTQYLLNEISQLPVGLAPMGGTALGRLSTEIFVEQKLIPLLTESSASSSNWALLNIIRECESRHGRRYVDEEGSPI